MSVRVKINSHPFMVIATIGVASVILCIVAVRNATNSEVVPLPPGMYFSSDDGVTWATGPVEDFAKVNPLPRVHIYRCSKDGKTFSGYLVRLVRGAVPVGSIPPLPFLLAPPAALTEIKKPGDKTWLLGSSSAAEAVRKVMCPSGDGGEVIEIQP